MPKTANQKTRILKVLEILTRYSDEEHRLSVGQILEKLSEGGTEADRKTVMDDLYALSDAGYDIDIQKGKNGGVCLLERSFEKAELKMLLDAVQCSYFIPEGKSKKLSEKLTDLASVYEAKELSRHFYIGNRVKSENNQLLYCVDVINRAINENRRIAFHYTDRNIEKELVNRLDGKRYTASPWELTVFDNNYYMICYDSYRKKLRHYRVDKMQDVVLTDRKMENRAELGDLNLPEYCTPIFGMFSGDKVGVSLRAPKRLIGVFIDRFGLDITLLPDGEDYFRTRVNVVISPPFFGWLFSLSDGNTGVEILSPPEVREEYSRRLLRAADDNQSS